MGWFKPSLGTIKNLPLIAGIGAAAAALPFVASGLRNSRRYDEDNAPPMPRELSDPLPPVLEYPPQMMQSPATMMGMEPVRGDFAKKVEMQRAGLSAGVDASAPSLIGQNGRNVIDGSGEIEALNLPGGRGV